VAAATLRSVVAPMKGKLQGTSPRDPFNAPEYPFPADVRDLEACYRGLVEKGITRIALWATGPEAIWRWCSCRSPLRKPEKMVEPQ
jgi:hypothetical protein